MATSKELEILCRGKSRQQINVIEYFCKQEGCLSKNMPDGEYMSQVRAMYDPIKLKQKAIDKIGLDEDEIEEIPPAKFEGFVFNNAFAKKRADGIWVSSCFQVSWIFFSSTQVYFYSYTFNMDDDKKAERTEEYFYKDVTSLYTSFETEEAKDYSGKKVEVATNKFAMVVPGDKLYVSMGDVKNAEEIIQAMKQKLREKKM